VGVICSDEVVVDGNCPKADVEGMLEVDVA
jgi:hypothetical protein